MSKNKVKELPKEDLDKLELRDGHKVLKVTRSNKVDGYPIEVTWETGRLKTSTTYLTEDGFFLRGCIDSWDLVMKDGSV